MPLDVEVVFPRDRQGERLGGWEVTEWSEKCDIHMIGLVIVTTSFSIPTND